MTEITVHKQKIILKWNIDVKNRKFVKKSHLNERRIFILTQILQPYSSVLCHITVIYDVLPFIRLFNNWFFEEMRISGPLFVWVCCQKHTELAVVSVLWREFLTFYSIAWKIELLAWTVYYIEHQSPWDVILNVYAMAQKATGTEKKCIGNTATAKAEQKKFALPTNFCCWLPDIITCLHDNRHVFAPLFYSPLFFIKWQKPCTVH